MPQDQELQPEAGVRASAIDEGKNKIREGVIAGPDSQRKALLQDTWRRHSTFPLAAGPFGGRISLSPTAGPVVWISPLGAVHMATRAVRSPTMGGSGGPTHLRR